MVFVFILVINLFGFVFFKYWFFLGSVFKIFKYFFLESKLYLLMLFLVFIFGWIII